MSMVTTQAVGVCDQCRLLRGDQSSKPVTWCGVCRAWLCEMCRRNPMGRALAALKRRLG